MRYQRRRSPLPAAFLLGLVFLIGPAVSSRAQTPSGPENLVTRMVKKAIQAGQLEGQEPAKPGLHEHETGWALVPPKLSADNPVAVLITAENAKETLENLTETAKATGVLVLAPGAVRKKDDFDPAATWENLNALRKAAHAQQKIVTKDLFVLALEHDCDDAWLFALQGKNDLTGCAVIEPADCPLEAKQLSQIKKLHFLVVSSSDKKTLAAAESVDKALKKASVASARLRKLQSQQDAQHEQATAAALRWIGTYASEQADDEGGKLAGDIAGATELLNKGKYKAAASSFKALMDRENLRLEAAIGLSRALSEVGKYAQAVESIEKAAKDGQHSAEWHLACAEALENVGQYETALVHARQARELRPAWAPALLAVGRLEETLGQLEQAKATYKAMEGIIDEGHYRSDARSLTALGQMFDRYTILTGARASDQATNILHNYLQYAYQKVDREYWPANIAAGMFLLSKHRADQANIEFKLALKHNPRCAQAYAGAAMGALESWQFEKCMELADKALKINPNHPTALMVKASCKMAWRKFDEVPPIVEKVLKSNPNHLDALSLLAAAHTRMRQEDKALPYIARIKAVNADYYGLPLAIAEWLSAGRQFHQAEQYYKKAIELRPNMAEPLAGLGKMYMQTGQEQQAREILQKANRIDDYRSDVANFLAVVNRLLDPDHFVVRETDHFIIKVDKNYDLIMLEQMAEYMESIYDEVCGDFDHYPQEKTIIEVMPTHEQFSLRIAGRGWIGTVGACTGRVIVLAAPHLERSQLGIHNWAQVMRHEYTHTVTLAATNNNIPHWFTEACAVWQQKDKKNYRYVRMLVNATRRDRLFSIKEIDWGFIRPKRRGDRSLAYAQAQWMMEYIISEHGFLKITDMLKAFGRGLAQEKVFEDVLGMPEEEFNAAFKNWARGQVVAWGFEPDKPADLKEAQKRARENAADAEAQAQLARSQLARRKVDQALKSANKALALDKANVTALTIRALALMMRGRHEAAIEAARELQKVDPTAATAYRVLAVSYLKQRKLVQAIEPLEELKVQLPLDSFSYEKLAEIYTQFGDPKKALPNLLHLHRHTMRDPKYARQIAETYRMLGREDLAEKYFQEVTYINPYETTAYQSMVSMQVRQKQYDQALETAGRLTLLEPGEARSWDYLAQIRYRKGRIDNDRELLVLAKQAAQKSIELDPNGLGPRILSAVEEVLENLPVEAE